MYRVPQTSLTVPAVAGQLDAGSQSKRNTMSNEVGEAFILSASSSGKKGLQTWRMNISPETNDIR
jgi:hypothetical protein